MKTFIYVTVSLMLIIPSFSYPQKYGNGYSNEKPVKLIRHENNFGTKEYNFAYETSDGSERVENAEIKYPGTKNESLSVHGSYTFIGTDGKTYKVTYVADENGYRATGEHLPKNE